MAIATRKPTAELPVTPRLPETGREEFLGIAADQATTPTASLVAYVEGLPWTVDYYGQLLGKHNDLREIDPGQNAAFQQYQKTRDLELRVTTPISTSYDGDTNITSVVGAATIVYIVPNVNDYFVADAGTNERGLYRITSVERMVFNRDSVYTINYTLVGYISAEQTLYTDLEAKVVRTYRFVKDRLVNELVPILTEEFYTASVNLAERYHALIQRYFQAFFNSNHSTLLVPKQVDVIYDSWLVNFLMKIVDSQDVDLIRQMRLISMDRDPFLAQGSLWSVLIDRRYDDLTYTCHEVCAAPRIHFNHSSWIKGPAYWNIGYFVYPKHGKDEASNPGDPSNVVYSYSNITSLTRMEDAPYSDNNTYAIGEAIHPLVKSVLIDDYYVLSEAFYTGSGTLSVLEILTRDYLKQQTIDLAMLTALVTAYPTWPVLERFYYGPLLILLLKDAIRGFY